MMKLFKVSEPKQKRAKKKRAKKKESQDVDVEHDFLDQIIAVNCKESMIKEQQTEAELMKTTEQMLELYKKRWSLVETYENKMKEIKEKTANGTLNMS